MYYDNDLITKYVKNKEKIKFKTKQNKLKV